jgi:hypothetical protein
MNFYHIRCSSAQELNCFNHCTKLNIILSLSGINQYPTEQFWSYFIQNIGSFKVFFTICYHRAVDSFLRS